MPHKQSIWSLLGDPRMRDDLDRQREGAVNCVTPIAGGFRFQNFDVDALMRTIPEGDGSVAVIGAGGAAEAAIEALLSRNVIVLARNATKGKTLATRAMEHGQYQPLEKAAKALRKVHGLINATPLGMALAEAMPEQVLDSLSVLRPDAFVYDMVYHPVRTCLLERAEELGLGTIDGLSMLIEQAALSFAQFFGPPAPRHHDAELRELLTR
jgi:shikimate dehydrogenase